MCTQCSHVTSLLVQVQKCTAAELAIQGDVSLYMLIAGDLLLVGYDSHTNSPSHMN